MISQSDITGIVLAGGKSSRFGSNKAMAVWNGETLLSRAINLLKPVCGDVWIGGNHPDFDHIKLLKISDDIPDSGPLGGIYSVMKRATTPYLLCMTCDMPLMKDYLLKRLLEVDDVTEITFWEQENGKLQLFPLLIARELLPLIKWKLMDESYSVRSLLPESVSTCVPVGSCEEHCFLNVNQKSDLEELEHLFGNDTELLN